MRMDRYVRLPCHRLLPVRYCRKDTEYDHIHMVASHIKLDGNLWHGKNETV